MPPSNLLLPGIVGSAYSNGTQPLNESSWCHQSSAVSYRLVWNTEPSLRTFRSYGLRDWYDTNTTDLIGTVPLTGFQSLGLMGYEQQIQMPQILIRRHPAWDNVSPIQPVNLNELARKQEQASKRART